MAVTARNRLTVAVAAALLSTAALPVLAQDRPQPVPPAEPSAAPPAEAPAETPAARKPVELDKLVVTGTRVQGRSPTQSLSPIDVFSPADLERQPSADFTDQLADIAPSFNTQRFPIADGTAFVRPANLRNLPPDQTLVLINGKRRHRSALVNLQTEPFGTVNQGSQAVDYSLIPAAAGVAISVATQTWGPAVIGIAVMILSLIAAGLITSALQMIVVAATYRYASTGLIPEHFDGTLLKQAFRAK